MVILEIKRKTLTETGRADRLPDKGFGRSCCGKTEDVRGKIEKVGNWPLAVRRQEDQRAAKKTNH
jgi:hypothetical protein